MLNFIKEYDHTMYPISAFESAVIGIGERPDAEASIVYDYEKCIKILMDGENIDRTEAVESLDFMARKHRSMGFTDPPPTYLMRPAGSQEFFDALNVSERDVILRLTEEFMRKNSKNVIEVIRTVYPDKRVLMISNEIDLSLLDKEIMRENGWVRIEEVDNG